MMLLSALTGTWRRRSSSAHDCQPGGPSRGTAAHDGARCPGVLSAPAFQVGFFGLILYHFEATCFPICNSIPGASTSNPRWAFGASFGVPIMRMQMLVVLKDRLYWMLSHGFAYR
eukprot:1157956-Pelagomonas_calceolata.AAC.12